MFGRLAPIDRAAFTLSRRDGMYGSYGPRSHMLPSGAGSGFTALDGGFIDELIRVLTRTLETLDDARVLARSGSNWSQLEP